MRKAYTQKGTSLLLTTPFADDGIQLTSVIGTEEISALFEFRLTMITSRNDLDFARIVGKSVTVSLELPQGGQRYFNGIVTRFMHTGMEADFNHYAAELRPALWTATLSRDHRIFQSQSVPDIVTGLLHELGVTAIRNALRRHYASREYCVQYGETAFAFVSRLLQEEGIFYFFEHANGSHTLVLADDSDAYLDCVGGSTVRMDTGEVGRDEPDAVLSCSAVSGMNSTKYSSCDYDDTTPASNLRVSASGEGTVSEIYDYPGGYAKKDVGEALASQRLASLESRKFFIEGQSRCRGFSPGHRFQLSGHDRADCNKPFVLVRVEHEIDQQTYINSFQAIPATTIARPLPLFTRNRVYGVQTAVVVGKAGEELWTDAHGRIKVQFHWDRQGKRDEHSSCWVRVAQAWAGKHWGAQFIPRLGQEVLVTFVDGDPDRPVVVGSVYNGEQTPPFDLPGKQAQWGFRSRSTKGGGSDNGNELRFDDSKGSEDIYLKAEKDFHRIVNHDDNLDVKHSQTETIENDRTVTLSTGSDTLTIKSGNHTIKVSMGKSTIEAMQGIELKVGSSSISIDQSGIKIKGVQVSIEGQAQATVKGAMTDIKGDGMVQIKGGITMIG